jgi:hypothetical protein
MIAKRRVALWVAALACAVTSALPAAAVNIRIFNFDDPGEGFNDASPVTPVGGNNGTTLGQQRRNAFVKAAQTWGQQLPAGPDVNVAAFFDPLPCSANSAVLGSAGPTFVEADFPGAPVQDHWYHVALANKLAGQDLEPGFVHIVAEFNSDLGSPGCLTGSPFYLGLDGNAPIGTIDLVTVLLHEFGHGIGFSTVTDAETGEQLAGLPSIYDKYAFDNSVGLAWDAMTDAQRATSAVNSRNLVWTGANVTANAQAVLVKGTPQVLVNAPSGAAGVYLAGAAAFGASLTSPGLTSQVMQVVDQPDGRGLACAPLDANNARAVKNRIALVDRGACTFVTKAKNVQDAGAVGMIVVDNAPGGPPADLGGADPAVAIPAVRVTLDTGNGFKAAINATPGGRSSGLVARLGLDLSQLAGADKSGRVMLYTPNPFQGGSSVSHWDTSAFRNLLMEPAINTDLTHNVTPPYDLTLPMLKDLGW